MKSTRLTRTFLILLPALLLAACGDDESTTSPAVCNGTVRVVDNQFIPATVTITVGDSVTWCFEGSNTHTVTEGATVNPPNPLFNSGNRNSGSFGYRFTTAGSFPYHCIPHFSQNMRGTITVQSP